MCVTGLVAGSASDPKGGRGVLPRSLVAGAEMSEQHYVEHLVCIGGVRTMSGRD